MKIHRLHAWDVKIDEARRIQKELVKKLRIEPLKSEVSYIAGADVSYSRTTNTMYAAIVVLHLPQLEIVESTSAIGKANFPYVPGFLSFREAPILLQAFEKLRSSPDVAMFDGQGIAHPLKLGLAVHLGLFLDIPTIGCAKKRLVGEFEEPGNENGAQSLLVHKHEPVGVVLRTKSNVKPVYISPGHKINLEGAVDCTLKTIRGFRLPEPTRQAHLLVNKIRTSSQP